MSRSTCLRSLLLGTIGACACAQIAFAANFNIPSGDLATALDAYAAQTGVELIVSEDALKGRHSDGASGQISADDALAQILKGTGFTIHREAGAIALVPEHRRSSSASEDVEMQFAQAAPTKAIETVTVTSSKLGGADVQSVPIAITALSQEQLTATQTAGGPDLVKQVPNLTFSKTNFTGYNIQIRGIGTQAISVTTDPAVAVAFNDIPFIRNHFFEQEFYDIGQLEVLRGPQGTLYGRNATAGVVNVVSARPTDQFEAMASLDVGNYQNRRVEGMLNIPVVDDRLDIRVAGEWTKRDGYTFDETTDKSVDGRDLWSGRVTVGWKPIESLQTYLVWEHFSEDDDRVRSAKQVCEKDPGPTSVDGLDLSSLPGNGPNYPPAYFTNFAKTWLSQGCLPASFYSKDAYETPNGQTLPFVAFGEFFVGIGNGPHGALLNQIDPYASQTQSQDLRVIQSELTPSYRAKNDTVEFNADFAVTPALTLASQTGYNKDFLYSTEDFNRFDTAPGLFGEGVSTIGSSSPADPAPGGIYCDPQLGCSSSMVGEDLSQERAWQFSQEVRLASSFSGPFNFSAGANYMHYQTVEDYYVLFNLITAEEQITNGQGPGDFTTCHSQASNVPSFTISPEPYTANFNSLFPLGFSGAVGLPSVFGCAFVTALGGKEAGTYIDPNPIDQLNGQGHNYFRSENPYRLNSTAGFGEAYYQVTQDLKLTGGLRWTDDSKTFSNIPSWVFELGGGYPVEGVVNQEWKEWTGRFVADWTPKIDFTDQTLFYASYSRGYKGGGANPPGPETDFLSAQSSVTHPATFAPEFVNAFELGTKNMLLDGNMTLNGDVFYYDYKGYQISQIVDRTSINLNFNAKVKGAELEAAWEPLPGLRFNFAGGLEDTSVDKGQSAIDLMNRTNSNPDWVVVRPFVTETSNCILPASVVRQILQTDDLASSFGGGIAGACDAAYNPGVSFIAALGGNSEDQSVFAAAGFNPATAPNNGEGFRKGLERQQAAQHAAVHVVLRGAIHDARQPRLGGNFAWRFLLAGQFLRAHLQ